MTLRFFGANPSKARVKLHDVTAAHLSYIVKSETHPKPSLVLRKRANFTCPHLPAVSHKSLN